MSRIHFIVKESAKVRYQHQAQREGKSLGQWMREAADEKLAAVRPRKWTVEELRRFNAACDARQAGRKESDWPEYKRIHSRHLLTRYPGLEARDLVHLACCLRRRVRALVTLDRALAAAWDARP